MNMMNVVKQMNGKSKVLLGGALAVTLVAAANYQYHGTQQTVTCIERQAESSDTSRTGRAHFDKGQFTIVHGKVTKVGTSSLTINVLKKSSEDESFTETGETKEITVSEDIHIKKGGGHRPNGQPPQGNGGQKPNGQPPQGNGGQKPDGQSSGDNDGQKPDGQFSQGNDSQNINGDSVPNGEPPLIQHDRNRPDSLSLSDISVGDEIVVLYDSDGNLKGIDIKSDDQKSFKTNSKAKNDADDSDDSDDSENNSHIM